MSDVAGAPRPNLTDQIRRLATLHPAFLLLACYYVVAFALYGVWDAHRWYPDDAGDEPHYIVQAKAMLDHGTLEVTEAYRDAISAQNGGRPVSDEELSGHFVEGPHGRFSFHAPGVSVIIAPAVAVSEALNYNRSLLIRAMMILVSGAAVLAAWQLSRLWLETQAARILAVALTCISLPMLLASGQIFPDLPGGVLTLVGLAWLRARWKRVDVPAWQDLAIAAVVCFLPWLQFKFAVITFVCLVALAFVVYESTRSRGRVAAILGLGIATGLLLVFYSHYAFGRLNGPPVENGALSIDRAFWVRLLGSEIDRAQGFMIVNPVFFVGLLFLIPFVVREWRVGLPALICFLYITAINASLSTGGFSYTGRYTWTGYLILLPVTIWGLGRIEVLSPRLLRWLAGGLLALQAVLLLPLFDARQELFNQSQSTWYFDYHSLYPGFLWRFLPALYNAGWAFSHPTNYVFLAVGLGLLASGVLMLVRRERLLLRAAAGLLTAGLLAAAVAGLVESAPPIGPRLFLAYGDLDNRFGEVEGTTLHASVARDSAGLWATRNLRLSQRDYKITLHYAANGPPAVKAGALDIATSTGQKAKALVQADLTGTDGANGEAGLSFSLPNKLDGKRIYVRLYFGDVVDMTIIDLVVEPVGEPP